MSDATTTHSTDEPITQKLGIYASYILGFPISTFLSSGTADDANPSEVALDHYINLKLSYAETFKRSYALNIGIPIAHMKGKLFDTTSVAGTTTDIDHHGFHVGLERQQKLYSHFDKDGGHIADLSLCVKDMMGYGKTTISQSDRELAGDIFTFEDREASTFDINSIYTLPVDLRPWGRGPVLSIGPAFKYGVQYDESYSEFNRLVLEFMLMFQVGYGDASSIEGGADDAKVGAFGITYGFYHLLHKFLTRHFMVEVLNRSNEALLDYGGLLGEGERGSHAKVPLLESAPVVLGGLDNSLSMPLRAGKPWFYSYMAALGLGGALFLIPDSDAARAGGVSDMLKAVRLSIFAMSGIESHESRSEHSDAEIAEREMLYVNLPSFAMNTAVMVIGGLAGSPIAMNAGVGANVSIALSPDPLDRELTERTDVSYVPYAYQFGDKSGARAGFRIHKSWKDVPMEEFQLYSSIMFLSPSFTFENAGNDINDTPYEDIHLNTDIDSSIGLEWKTTFTRLYFGASTKAIFGGHDAKAGIGAVAGFDVLIPVDLEDSWGFTFGGSFGCHKIFDGDYQCEVAPHFGVTF